ncbi:hypothetical protein DRO56_05450 [Candidatus Bathyarchaeota archaeon]|nr:MAG: hypothetical protein DRO56_05450 [Candidatus Bathyarchaeota archaeon]
MSLLRLKKIGTVILTNRHYTLAFWLLLALSIRLTALLLIPVDWNWDSFHHWQIAYFTLKIGLRQGRMWDLGGMEYFWGVFPHLVEAALLWLLRTTSILPYRVLNMVLGSLTVWLVYLTGRDQFYWRVGLHAALLSALCPVLVIFDILALQDTLALFLAVAAFYLHRRHPILSGILFGLASQSRIELWPISLLFILGVLLYGRDVGRFTRLLLGWLIVLVPFMWFFQTRTGNPVYPLYWSFYDALGGWRGSDRPPLSVLAARFFADWSRRVLRSPAALGLASPVLLSVASLLYMFWRPPRRYALYSLFLISFLFCGFYTLQYLRDLFLFLIVLRILMLPAVLGTLILAHIASKPRLRAYRLREASLILFLLLLASAIPAYQRYQCYTIYAFQAADDAMRYYHGGRIVCDLPTVIYRIADRWGVPVTDLLSNHYNPFYYGNRTAEALVDWFRAKNITLWIYTGWQYTPEILRLLEEERPSLLILRESVYDIWIFEVNTTALWVS